MGKIRLLDRIKNALKYYPEEDELPIDWCPICEEKMRDNKRKTRIEHNKLKHPPDPKKKRKQLINNLIFFTIIGIFVLGMVLFVDTLENQKVSRQYCIDQRDELNAYIRTERVFPFEQQERINMLVEKCNLIIGLGSYTNYDPSELP